MDDKLICCETCQKTYKTKGGLTKHIKAKHPSSSQEAHGNITKPMYMAVIKKLVNEAKNDLSADECYPSFIRNLASSYKFEVIDQDLLNKIVELYNSLCKNSKAEKFYSCYYQTIALNAKKYFKTLNPPVCTILATLLCDKILAYFNKKDEEPKVMKPITSKELDGLKYLAGYVIHAVHRKLFYTKRVITTLDVC
eukprot:gene11655-12854_t